MMPATVPADDWAIHLARFVASLRPDWQVPGIRTAIHNARHRGTPEDIAHALIDLTKRDDLRTPALLADDGPWWHTGRTPETRVTRAKCTQPGHEHELATNCRACRADALAGDGPSDPPAWSPDQAARNAAGARRALEALDHARRAAGERDNDPIDEGNQS